MTYWLTTHWPHRIDIPENEPHSGVWVPSEKQRVISHVKTGDLVFIYETGRGKTELRRRADGQQVRVPCRQGRQGIVALVKVTAAAFEPEGSEPEQYIDGSTVWWRWHAPTTPINTAGFIPREAVAELLGYSSTYNFRGFGEDHSGISRLTDEKFHALLRTFTKITTEKDQETVRRIISASRVGPGGESPEHQALKDRVAGYPIDTLHEPGLRLYKKEMLLPSADKIDVVLQDQFGRLVAVEIEVDCSETELVGPLQCAKYRSMLAYLFDRPVTEVRTILVAYSIHPAVQERCQRHGIEVKEVTRGR